MKEDSLSYTCLQRTCLQGSEFSEITVKETISQTVLVAIIEQFHLIVAYFNFLVELFFDEESK